MKFDDKTFVLGVGAQKSGTTWLHDYLSQRGDVFMPRRKELHYFDAKYRPDITGAKRRDRLTEWNAPSPAVPAESLHTDHAYREFFRDRVPDDIDYFGEITPTYALIGETGYRKIRELFHNRRLIFIMRDPIERFYSQTRMFRNKRDAKAKPQIDAASLAEHRRFMELSCYENTIRALDATFGPGEIVYLFYETLFREETIRSLCQSLGLSYRPADFQAVVNSSGTRDPSPEPMHERLLAKFEPTYQFCRRKFGADLPREWHGAGGGDQPGQ
ncbi:MAG: sulfotransferase [Rhizomicrobium sp.]|jgi:hypothetical protein